MSDLDPQLGAPGTGVVITGGASGIGLAAAQALADRHQSVVVLKGSGTVIAAPGQPPRVNPTGNARLATAGTGDVLGGIVGALLAAKVPAFEAAAAGAWLHGTAAALAPSLGMVAGDIAGHLPAVLESLA